MTDIATLGVKVTSEGVSQTEQQLDKLAKTGARAEQSTQKLAPAMDKAARSAKELQAATRNLPAQFTDIATGLASGQRPLQVLFQQGGQLKDMFGGIGPAASAMGRYIAGLANPVTIAAAAVGGLALAWKAASDEADAFSRALITTGANASLTVGDLRALADELDATTSATEGKASDVLVQVTATGKFTAEQLQLVARAAIQMEDATGQAIEETIKQFASLRDDPVNAVLKLNDTQHFLEQSTYDTIKAFDEQGRSADAASTAIRGYADTISSRAGQVEDNLSTWAALLRDIKHAAAEAGDSVIELARNLGEAKVTGDLTVSQLATNSVRNLLGLGSEGASTPKPAARAGDPYDFLHSRPINPLAGNGGVVDSAVERARLQFDREGLKFATQRAKMEQDIKDARALGVKAGLDEVTIAKREAEIRAEYARREPKGRQPRAAREQRDPTEEAYKRLNASMAEQIALFDKTGEAARVRYQIEQGELSKLSPAKQQELVRQAEEIDALNAQKKAREEVARRLDQEADARRRAVENADRLIEDMQFELDLLRMTAQERERAIALRYLEADATDAQRAAVAALSDENFRAREAAGKMDDFRRNFSDTLVDIASGAASATDAIKAFFDEWAAQIMRAIANRWTEQLFGSMGSTGGGSAGGWVSAIFSFFGGGGGFASGGYTGPGGVNQPAGTVHKGEIVWSQADIARAGGVGAVERMRMGAAGAAPVTIQQSIVVQGRMTRETPGQIGRATARAAGREVGRTGQ